MAVKSQAGAKLDFATIGGVVLAFAGILGGLLLEGGELRDIAQVTAAIIVLGGTLGAVLINTPLDIVLRAMRRTKGVLFEGSSSEVKLVEELIEYATTARKNGIVALEKEASMVKNPFLKRALTLAVDGTDILEMRKMLEGDIGMHEHHAEAEAKVFEAAGGYAPTIGIIGAVLGLIQVMKNLSNIDAVGHGIAVSFVATVYGVAIANIVFLPVANKIKARAQQEAQVMEMIVEGVISIVEGMNPKLIRSKLEIYIPPSHGKAKSPGPS